MRKYLAIVLPVAAWILFALALYHAGILGWYILQGGAETAIPSFKRVLLRMALVAAALLGWQILRRWTVYTRRDWLVWSAKMALFAVSLGLSVAVAEIGVRAILIAKQNAGSMERLKTYWKQGKKPPVRSSHPLGAIIRPSDDPRLVYDLQPGLDMDFGHCRLRTNRAGMRSNREYPVARVPRSVRIMGLGDSGMFGWNVAQELNYLAVLESNLNARADGITYEVLNLAVPGYNTQLEVASLRAKGLAYRPDIVIVGWCDNDFSLPYFLWEKQDFRRRDISYLYLLLFQRAKIDTGLILRDQRTYDKTQVIPELASGTDIEGVTRALRELRALGRENGFQVLVFGPMHKEIRQICEQVDVPYYNTFKKIPDDNYPANYHIHFMHPRAGGHRVLAEHLERELTERGWLKPRE